LIQRDIVQDLSPDFEADIQFVLEKAKPIQIRELQAPEIANGSVGLVDETGQYSGSFKYRGAVLGVSKHPAGVVACGSGNFPIAVGLAASTLEIPAILVMPEDTPLLKKGLALKSGAEVLFFPRKEFVALAEREAESRGVPLLHPYKDPEMLIGSCSLGLEMARAIRSQGSRADAVIVACGGGGLAAGVALGLRLEGAANDVYVAEPQHYQRLSAALSASRPIEIEPSGPTVCDALRATEIGALAFELLSGLGVCSLPATDQSVIAAQKLLHEACSIRAEPSGALALASLFDHIFPERHDRYWVVLCGGNC
jgi:threonine dehydratase